jgi:hypothetical protein
VNLTKKGLNLKISYFLNLIQTQSQKGQKLKNPAAQQRSSPQGCTVRPETSSGQSSLPGGGGRRGV